MSTDAYLEQLKDALATALPGRLVTREWLDPSQRKDEALQQGVITLISRREQGYADYPGREAQLGTLELALIGQLHCGAKGNGLDVERAELALVEEVKAFVANRPDELGNLALRSWEQSGQLEAPYGWVAFSLNWYLN